MKYTRTSLFLGVLFLASGCSRFEAIKSYRYPISKYNLEKVVSRVINSNPNIIVDTTELEVTVLRNPNDPNDTTTRKIKLSDFHDKKDSAEVAAHFAGVTKIRIKAGTTDTHYTFRYAGEEQDWKNSENSTIFIQEITDMHGNTFRQGENENGEFNTKIAKDLTVLFEKEVVSKIDKELNLKHKVD